MVWDVQVLRVLPYSACQLCSYEAYKRLLGGGPNGEGLSVPRRLAAGAAAGMTSTLVGAA
jgi:solute carrier family 25 (mitochondrial phosphate transporter), member 23/24/25/41